MEKEEIPAAYQDEPEEEIPEIAGLKVTRVKEYRITRMTFLTYADEYGG